MNSRSHKRTPTNGLKNPPAPARPNRPSLAKRNSSYHNVRPQSGVTPRSPTGGKRPSEAGKPGEMADDDASFLQFCATCEKQIVTPTLYCSEACRRKDSVKSMPSHVPYSPELSPAMAAYNHRESAPANIMQQRSPTVLRPLSNTFSELDLSETSPRSSESNEDYDDYDDAHVQDLPGFPSHCLTHFHPTDWKRNSTGVDAPPSLVHSPSSSYGTVSSFMSTRPLPPKHTHSSNKSADLVIPMPVQDPPSPKAVTSQHPALKSKASTSTSFRVAQAGENDVGGEDARRWSVDKKQTRNGSAQENLRQLFSHDAIRAAPRHH